jgi:hypothetical protein
VDPSRVEWTVGNTDPTPQTLSVSVTRTEALSVTVNYEGQPLTDWLVAEVATTANTATILLTATPQDLDPGVYGGFVIVTAPGYAAARIDVLLTITP